VSICQNGSLFQVLSYHQTLFQPSTPGILPASLRPDSKWKSQNPTLLRRQFLAASTPLSGDWLLALPVASCGFKLDDEVVHVARALRLGLNHGALHTCCCGVTVDALSQYSLVCKQDSHTSAPERPGDPCLGMSGHPCHKGTTRSYTQRR